MKTSRMADEERMYTVLPIAERNLYVRECVTKCNILTVNCQANELTTQDNICL